MKRNAQISSEFVLFIPKIIFLVAVIFAFVLLVKTLLVSHVDVRDIESSVLLNRMLFSPALLIYQDPISGRYYPGVIDLGKFTSYAKTNPNVLDSELLSYGAENPIIAVQMILKQSNNPDVVVYYNKEKFDKWEPRALSTIKGGTGSVKSFKERKYVAVYDGASFSPALLDFYIIT